jgi:hypothetical protein
MGNSVEEIALYNIFTEMMSVLSPPSHIIWSSEYVSKMPAQFISMQKLSHSNAKIKGRSNSWLFFQSVDYVPGAMF